MSDVEKKDAEPQPEPLAPEILAEIQRKLVECWPRARSQWSQFLLLGEPVEDSEHTSIAQIDLATRRVTVNGTTLHRENLLGSIEAILAHEIGHHVRYPGSLRVEARLRTIERPLLPLRKYSLTNLFTDLMINHSLAADLREQLLAVYRAFSHKPAFHADEQWKRDPLFSFYLAIYEELWQQPPGSIVGPAVAEFERSFPKFRSEAQLLAQNLFGLGPNLYTQFLYFVSIATAYIQPLLGDEPVAIDPFTCHCGEPSPDDWADALNPSRRERDAIERAIREGWFAREYEDALRDLGKMDGRLKGHVVGRGGKGDPKRIPEVMASWYRAQAENYLLRPPPQRRLGDALVPTTLEEWEIGDSSHEIDWTTTLVERGEALGTIQPMKRIMAAEYLGHDVTLWQPKMEIYLDVSGSMPDPGRAVNSMTLAAQILSMGTIREGGWVRAALYSTKTTKHWDWCRSEREISRFLMRYIGQGTKYPFELLAKSIEECSEDQPIRVVISDQDFDRNLSWDDSHPEIVVEATDTSPHFILLQHRPNRNQTNKYRKMGVHVVEVHKMDDFPRMATDLTNGLFPDELSRNQKV